MVLKIKVFLMGGFGNNLFQLGLGLHLRDSGSEVVYCDYLLRSNRITKFLGWTLHSDSMLRELLLDERVESKLSVMDFLFLVYVFTKSKIIGSRYMNQFECGVYQPFGRMAGYWQEGEHLNVKTVKLLRMKMIGAFKLYAGAASLNSRCSVHFRRGDFPLNWTISNGYYKDCMCLSECEEFCLVSNCPDVYSEIDTEKKVICADGSSQLEDFKTLWFSPVVVCSNSTFCYWAAILGDSQLLFIPKLLSSGNANRLQYYDKKVVYVESEFLSDEI